MLDTILDKTRQRWYQAYFDGDTTILSTLEHPSFTYICDQGIERVDSRYLKIDAAKAANQWFHPSTQRQDIRVSYQALGSVFYVHGLAQINSINTHHRRYFSEVWLQDNNQWQIISLHATIANESLL